MMEHKKGLIESSDLFIEVCILRNYIKHEYLPESILEIFNKVIDLTPALLNGVRLTIDYCNKQLKTA